MILKVLVWFIVVLFTTASWNSDTFRKQIGSVVFSENVINRCSEHVFALDSMKVILNVSRIRDKLQPLDFKLFDEKVVELQKFSEDQLKSAFGRRCSKRHERGLAGVVFTSAKAIGKGTAAVGKLIKANKASFIFNLLTTGVGFIELGYALKTSSDVDNLKAKVHNGELELGTLSSVLDLAQATSLIQSALILHLTDLKAEIGLLMDLGKIYGTASSSEPANEIIDEFIILESCSTETSTVNFKLCTKSVPKEFILPLFKLVHSGSFSDDNLLFSKILFNDTFALKNGKAVPLILGLCAPPSFASFYKKAYVCSRDAVVPKPCSIDDVGDCEIRTTKIGSEFLNVDVVDDTYVIGTRIKSFNIINKTSGSSTHREINGQTFVLALPSDCYAAIGSKKLVGLKSTGTTEYTPKTPELEIDVGLWTSKEEVRSFRLHMVDSNHDEYPDDKRIIAETGEFHLFANWIIFVGALLVGLALVGAVILIWVRCFKKRRASIAENLVGGEGAPGAQTEMAQFHSGKNFFQ